MARLIDADVACKGCVRYGSGLSCEDCVVNDSPTVDAVEVVRCRDCIHYDFGVCLKIYSDGAVSQYAWQARNEDDFCSYGERKEGADNG